MNPIKPLRYIPLERIKLPRPVDRVKYIAKICAGCDVLDLGAMDETAWKSKRGRGTWLHEEISLTALCVHGVDNSPMVPVEGISTGPNAIIRRGDIRDPIALVEGLPIAPDVVVAGELIEHIDSPLQFLKQFVGVERLAGKSLILSTPNATAVHNFLIGLARCESTHRDHLCIFSFKTLTTLSMRAGFLDWEIIPYFSRFTEIEARHTGVLRFVIRAVQRVINVIEWIFPMVSFGYILRVRL